MRNTFASAREGIYGDERKRERGLGRKEET